MAGLHLVSEETIEATLSKDTGNTQTMGYTQSVKTQATFKLWATPSQGRNGYREAWLRGKGGRIAKVSSLCHQVRLDLQPSADGISVSAESNLNINEPYWAGTQIPRKWGKKKTVPNVALSPRPDKFRIQGPNVSFVSAQR